jgi:hypothetical protein
MGDQPDKPEGTEQHPPNVNPARRGPGEDGAEGSSRGKDPPPPASGEPRPEASPGERGVSGPKRGKM